MKKLVCNLCAIASIALTSSAFAASTTTTLSGNGTNVYSINIADTLFTSSFDGVGITGVNLSGPANYSFAQNFITDSWEFTATNFVSGAYNLTVSGTGAWVGQYTTTLGAFVPTTPVPEPETNMMMLLGLLGVASMTYRKTKSA